MSNLETLLTAWLNDGTIPDDFEPETRIEEYLVAILEGVDDDVTPESRADVLLDAIASKYAGYADGISDLRDETGMTAHHVSGSKPDQIAAFLRAINTIALQDLTAKGATGVNANTCDILDAYAHLPSGGAELNIGYGNTAPEDTTALWVKTAQPQNVTVDYDIDNGVESVQLMTEQLPTGASGIACGVVGTNCYLFGGIDQSSRLDTINKYDTSTNTITTLATTLPQQLRSPACGVVGTTCYIFGGLGNGNVPTNAIYAFDTSTNTITTVSATLPQALQGPACGVVGTKIYLFGGWNNNPKNPIYEFDAEAETLSTVSATLPTAAYNMACCVVGTKIYLFGGNTANGRVNTIVEFDTETASLRTLTATMPAIMDGAAGCSIGATCYIFGGFNSIDGYSSRICAFDASNETVTTLTETLSGVTWVPTCGAIGKRCYIFGGEDDHGTRLKRIDKFISTFTLNEGDVYIQEDMLRNKFTLLPAPTEVKTGVSAVYVGNAQNEAEYAEALLYDGAAWQPIT